VDQSSRPGRWTGVVLARTPLPLAIFFLISLIALLAGTVLAVIYIIRESIRYGRERFLPPDER
jgi:hypothetical protein